MRVLTSDWEKDDESQLGLETEVAVLNLPLTSCQGWSGTIGVFSVSSSAL